MSRMPYSWPASAWAPVYQSATSATPTTVAMGTMALYHRWGTSAPASPSSESTSAARVAPGRNTPPPLSARISALRMGPNSRPVRAIMSTSIMAKMG
jgi:hypothetical protein